MNFKKSNVSYKAAKVFVAPFDPTDTVAQNIPARTITNENDNIDNVAAYLDTNYTFERMAWFKNVKISDTFENEVVDEVDDCDIWERKKTSEISTIFTWDWLTTLDFSVVKIILWVDFASKPWTPVVWQPYTLAANWWSQDKFYRLPFQHHDANGNIIKPTTYSATAWWVWITDWTDYRLEQNSYWEYGIVLYSTVATTDEVVLTYNYTPIDMEMFWFDFGNIIQPYMIVKLITCPDENGKTHTYYITKASLSWSLDVNFIAKWEVPLSSITLKWWNGWAKYVLKQK